MSRKSQKMKSSKLKNLVIVKADIDRKKIPKFTLHSLNIIKYHYPVVHVEFYKTESKHYHLRVWINKKLSDPELILLQLLLGSDKYRERMNFIRYLNGGKMEDWNLLFTKKLNLPLNSDR